MNFPRSLRCLGDLFESMDVISKTIETPKWWYGRNV